MAEISNNRPLGGSVPSNLDPPTTDRGSSIRPSTSTPISGGNLSLVNANLDERIRTAVGFASSIQRVPIIPPPLVMSGGMSAEEVIAQARMNRAEKAQNEVEADAVPSKSPGMAALEKAAQNYSAELGGAISRWTEKNPDALLRFGLQAMAATVTAFATGGASLAKDLPALGVSALAIGAGVLAESGIKPERLIGDMASVALQAVGVDQTAAEKWGKTIGSLSGAAMELTLFYVSNGTHKIDTAKFGTLAQDFASSVGADRATAAMVAATATGLASVGVALLAGQNLQSLVSADALQKSVMDAAGKIAQSLGEGKVNIPELLSIGSDVQTKFQKLMFDFQADTNVTDFWENAGPLAEKLAQSVLGMLFGQSTSHSALQA